MTHGTNADGLVRVSPERPAQFERLLQVLWNERSQQPAGGANPAR